jgi:serine/threonine protein kinase
VGATTVDDADVSCGYGAELTTGAHVGEYVIERKLGQGGMGSVYAAVHEIIDKRVAIKILRREVSDNEEIVARFVGEARAVNRIRHPNIVDVFGYGTTDDGRCFLVMELLEGESLASRLQYDRPRLAEACAILTEILRALEAAHAHGIVHRDLKPDNVFLLSTGAVKLLDFGIAKLTEPNERLPPSYTQPGQAIGTPQYIAPEQARGDTVDGRTDVYSLGVVAFELLTGRLPFDGENAMDLVAKHLMSTPPTPTSIAPALPIIADVLLLEMLAKEPALRPSLGRVRELLDELRTPRAAEPVRVGNASQLFAECVGSCSVALPPTVLIPTISAFPGSVQTSFDRWLTDPSFATCGLSAQCTPTLSPNQDTLVIALFGSPPPILTLTVDANGSVTATGPTSGVLRCGPAPVGQAINCAKQFAANESVTIVADPHPNGNGFLAWTGCPGGPGGQFPNCSVTMTGSQLIGAKFSPRFNVVVDHNDPQSFTFDQIGNKCGPAPTNLCVQSFPMGTMMEVTADGTKPFLGWQNTCPAGDLSPTCTFKLMTDVLLRPLWKN